MESNGRKEEVLKNIIEANMYIDNFWSEIMMDITKFDTLQKIKLRHFYREQYYSENIQVRFKF